MRAIRGAAPDAQEKEPAATPAQIRQEHGHALDGRLIEEADDLPDLVQKLS